METEANRISPLTVRRPQLSTYVRVCDPSGHVLLHFGWLIGLRPRPRPLQASHRQNSAVRRSAAELQSVGGTWGI